MNMRDLLCFALLLSSGVAFQPLIRSFSSTTRLRLADEIQEYRRGLNGISNHTSAVKSNILRPIDCAFKFGGSSLADAERIDHVAHLIKDQIQEGYRPRAVICSAMGKTTNDLLVAGQNALDGRVSLDSIRALAQSTIDTFHFSSRNNDEVMDLLDECEQLLTGISLLGELSAKSLDLLVSYGERCSVRMVAARLNQVGVPSIALDAWDVGIYTDSQFGEARILDNSERKIQTAFERIDPNSVAVVTGFIGHDPNGRITTLGRGGSDLTATVIGSALELDEVVCWKDVDGILTSDPRLVPDAIPINQLSFEEASELAYFGAKVLHPIAMQPAMKKNIPVRIKNSYNPSAVGTIIQQDESSKNENHLVGAHGQVMATKDWSRLLKSLFLLAPIR
jgi:aspartate kinase